MLIAKEIRDRTDKQAVLEKAAELAAKEGFVVEYRIQIHDEFVMILPDIEDRIKQAADEGRRFISPLGEYSSMFKKDLAAVTRQYFNAFGFTCHENMNRRTVYNGSSDGGEVEIYETFINW